MSRQLKNIINSSAFLLAIYLVSFVGRDIEATIYGINAFSFVLITAVSVQVIAFIPSYLLRTEKVYDLVGSLTYIAVVSVAYTSVVNPTTLDTLIFVYVLIWAGRLGTYLFRRVRKDGKDVRFDKAKQHFFWFLQFWMGQALWVSLTACAAVIAILSPEPDTLSTFVIVGAAIWWFGFIYESIADYQKRVFRKSHDPHTEFINTGLWSRSRHPNYFGEITLWTGILIMSLHTITGVEYGVIISPIFVYILLTRMSGVNLLTAIGKKRYGHLPEYQDYLKNTPKLFPKLFS